MPSVRPSEFNKRRREDGGPFLIVVPHPEHPNLVDVCYSEVPESDITETTPMALLLTIQEEAISIWPINTRQDRADHLQPKYDSLHRIILTGSVDPSEIPKSQDEVEDLLEVLPAGFAKNFRFGLGFLWEYRQIAYAIAEVPGIHTLIITAGSGAQIIAEHGFFVLGIRRFEAIRKDVNRVAARFRGDALKDKKHLIYHELLHAANPGEFPVRRKSLRKDLISDLTRGGRDSTDVSRRDQQAAVELVRDNIRNLAKIEPRKLLTLKSEIELASISELIAQFDSMLEKSLTEPKWQKFFEDNPFILSLAFSVPVFFIQGNTYVGGKRIDGRGGKFADFLYATANTGNLALIEIKKPGTELLSAKAYRGDEVFGPSDELGGAIAQLLDQKQKLTQELPIIKSNSERNDIHGHAIRCILVAGSLPAEAPKRRSFELLRNSMSQMDVVTFDELRARLESIRSALTPPPAPPMPGAHVTSNEDSLPAWLKSGSELLVKAQLEPER
ncbi:MULTISPECIES: Shedu immune nuclease family protein [Lysobacter]|uniref:Shedu immune nuclease family protein n=1 Tax=Lysobacter TaxID=68 RepID=UPI001F348BFC|nr:MULTISPECIES: Shedu immune nuclease family protein [Lysobacter]UJB19233.1 DUF4263 domain-containing protein [Lysobacter capsici]UJQ27042.1 DUF4263 domain-containing protein [Lysobacter gummosus]